jgi:hypothetical protein
MLKVLPAIVAVNATLAGFRLAWIITVTEPESMPISLRPALRPDTVHAHDDDDGVTAIVAMPPADDTVSFDGLMANEQALPNCVTTSCWPATMKGSVRADVPGFGTTEYDTTPTPMPLAPDTIVAIDGGGPVVVHEQPGPADTLKLPLPPVAGTVADWGLSE